MADFALLESQKLISRKIWVLEKSWYFHSVEINIVWNFIITQWVVTLKSYFAYVSSTSTTLKWCYTWLYEIILHDNMVIIMRNGKMDNVDVLI